MTPLEWAKRPLYKYADFTGRASRPEYWWYVLANVLAFTIATMIDSLTGLNGLVLGVYGPVSAALALGLLSPTLAITARRLHDTGRSGWWILLTLVPFVGLVVVYFLVLEGTDGPNEYGTRPETDAQPA